MRNWFKRPSAAMVVAVVALASSFAGPAAADGVKAVASAFTGKDIKNGSITNGDVKDNSLTGRDIANGGLSGADVKSGTLGTSDYGDNTIRGDKVRPNSLDGSDIQDNDVKGVDVDEATLGKVPSAVGADFAGRAASAAGADTARPFNVTLRHGGTADLAKVGSIRLYARCYDNGGPTYAEIYAGSSKNGAFGGGDDESNIESFGPGTPEDERDLDDASSSSTPSMNTVYHGVNVIGGADGEAITANVALWAEGDTDTCKFAGGAVTSG